MTRAVLLPVLLLACQRAPTTGAPPLVHADSAPAVAAALALDAGVAPLAAPDVGVAPLPSGTILFTVSGFIMGGGGSIGLHLTVLPDGQARLDVAALGHTVLPRHAGRVGDFAGVAPAADLATLRGLIRGLKPPPAVRPLPSMIMTQLAVVTGGKGQELDVPADRAEKLQGAVLRIMAAIDKPVRAVEARLVVAEGRARIDLVGLGAEPLSISVVGEHPSDFLAVTGGATTTREDAARLAAGLEGGVARLAAGATLSLPLPAPPAGDVRVGFHVLGPGLARARAETVPVAVAAPAAAAVELTLTTATPTTRVDEDLVIELALVNRGAAERAVNGRLALNSPGVPAPFRDVTLEVSGPAGYASNTVSRLKIGAPGAEHVVRLAPGGRTGAAREATLFESLHLPGRYRIVAVYESAEIAGAGIERGPLRSAPLEVERR